LRFGIILRGGYKAAICPTDTLEGVLNYGKRAIAVRWFQLSMGDFGPGK